jgi:hypothetical protein
VFLTAIVYQGAFASLYRSPTALTALVSVKLYFRFLADGTVLACKQLYGHFLVVGTV